MESESPTASVSWSLPAKGVFCTSSRLTFPPGQRERRYPHRVRGEQVGLRKVTCLFQEHQFILKVALGPGLVWRPGLPPAMPCCPPDACASPVRSAGPFAGVSVGLGEPGSFLPGQSQWPDMSGSCLWAVDVVGTGPP